MSIVYSYFLRTIAFLRSITVAFQKTASLCGPPQFNVFFETIYFVTTSVSKTVLRSGTYFVFLLINNLLSFT